MTFRRSHLKLLALAATCVALGAAISAIATAGAATSTHAHRTAAKAAAGRGLGARLLHRSVHGDFVVRTKSGFATVTIDRGTVVSVSGQSLTLREGTPKATLKTVTLTIPADARVRADHAPASLAQLKAGERALVITLPKRTLVIARTAKHA